MMTSTKRILWVLLFAGVIVLARLGHQVYRWVAYGEERARVEALRGDLEEVGVEVVRTHLAADSLRDRIERMDRDLEAARRAVDAYDLYAVAGTLPPEVYESYRRHLDGYNATVEVRNRSLAGWRQAIERNREAVRRYNALADSIRGLAAAMGEPYYPIPSPAEIAASRGLVAGGR